MRRLAEIDDVPRPAMRGARRSGGSPAHCRNVADSSSAPIDANSAGGTWVNGLRITRHELQQGDLITVGTTEMAFQWSDVDEKLTEAWRPAGDE